MQYIPEHAHYSYPISSSPLDPRVQFPCIPTCRVLRVSAPGDWPRLEVDPSVAECVDKLQAAHAALVDAGCNPDSIVVASWVLCVYGSVPLTLEEETKFQAAEDKRLAKEAQFQAVAKNRRRTEYLALKKEFENE